MNDLTTDREFQAAWADERYANTMLGLPGPLRREFVEHWTSRQKVSRERMARRKKELQS